MATSSLGTVAGGAAAVDLQDGVLDAAGLVGDQVFRRHGLTLTPSIKRRSISLMPLFLQQSQFVFRQGPRCTGPGVRRSSGPGYRGRDRPTSSVMVPGMLVTPAFSNFVCNAG